MSYVTAQEDFWAGEFGDLYIGRNAGTHEIAAKTAMFARILSRTNGVASVRELGANIGLNLLAIRNLLPSLDLQAIEINTAAHDELARIPGIRSACGSLLDAVDWPQVDMAFTAGVLIHVNPDQLPTAYQRLVEASRRYVLVAEYYNPSPTAIPYRGHSDRLFKRDFAGEILEAYPSLHLVDYGFIYHRDPLFPTDDITWFLLEKR
ncbi:pseudaminic acid biosynthesis-associated methylase [Ciceribacter lividus]|uniref:Pseudaminic acid biosynthesis-associated methylase n=1 Tax=Ciceribacter lividus TaxID=1197950 RepID=A0A6I7HNB4_9HYPH|nr:pseudaminic acid biosynthesis-associated methylase [Ciceribacter lividus]